MKAKIEYLKNKYWLDFSKPIDLSIPIKEGDENPNCYNAKDPIFKTIKSGDFIGSVAEGGSVNYQEITITPHGNGTHTEVYGHISADKKATISEQMKDFHCLAQLLTVTPQLNAHGDLVVRLEDIENRLEPEIKGLILRSLPNLPEKKVKKYSGSNPPYLDEKVTKFLAEMGIKHLLVDLPSIDKEVDGGALLAHRNFWGLPNTVRKECSITELIYVDNQIEDSIYFLNLHTINLFIDASPSRPVIYKLEIA